MHSWAIEGSHYLTPTHLCILCNQHSDNRNVGILRSFAALQYGVAEEIVMLLIALLLAADASLVVAYTLGTIASVHTGA